MNMRMPHARPVPAMTNTERQRKFRERNPGYYQRLHARRKAEIDAMCMAMNQAAVSVEEKVVLCLPAPVVELSIFDLIRDLQKQSEARDAVVDQALEAR